MKKIVQCLMIIVVMFTFTTLNLSAASGDVYNIVTTPGENMATQMRINCQSVNTIKSLQVEYTLATDVSFSNKKTVSGSYVSFSRTNSTGISYLGFETVRNVWNFNLEDLVPNAEYIYRICANTTVYGDNYKFKTASNNPDDEFSFLFMTDPQYYNESGASLFNVMTEKNITDYDIQFAFITGDISDKGGNSSYWDMFFTKSSLRKIPFATTVGNHEYYDSATYTVDNSIYNHYFNNPKNGPENVKNSSYYFLYNNTLFFMIDTEEKGHVEEQKAWFKSVCNKYTPNYIIVGEHRSIYAGGPYVGDGKIFKALWQSTFDECGVDLVLSGHDHTYSRTYSIYNDEIIDEKYKGTVYILGGSSGNKFYNQTDNTNKNKWAANFANETSSTVITVGKDDLKIKTISYSEKVKDEATIERKHFGTKNPEFNKTEYEDSFIVENALPDLTNGTISWSKDGYGYVSTITCYNKNSSAKIASLSLYNDLMTSVKIKGGFWIGEINIIEINILYRDGTTSKITRELNNNIDWGSLSNLTASELTDKTVTLSWNQDLKDSYIYRYRIYANDRLIKNLNLNDDARSLPVYSCEIVTGLNPNTKYTITVVAVNVNGTEVWSEEVAIKTKFGDTDEDKYQKSVANIAIAMLIENLLNGIGK